MWRFRHAATRFLNPFIRPLAGWFPYFGVLTHRGRTTGRTYRTPVNAFLRGDRYLFFLTYGADVHWVKNVLAAGNCSLRTRKRDVTLVEPELITDPELRLAPRVVRFIEGRAGVTEVLRLRIDPSEAGRMSR